MRAGGHSRHPVGQVDVSIAQEVEVARYERAAVVVDHRRVDEQTRRGQIRIGQRAGHVVIPDVRKDDVQVRVRLDNILGEYARQLAQHVVRRRSDGLQAEQPSVRRNVQVEPRVPGIRREVVQQVREVCRDRRSGAAAARRNDQVDLDVQRDHRRRQSTRFQAVRFARRVFRLAHDALRAVRLVTVDERRRTAYELGVSGAAFVAVKRKERRLRVGAKRANANIEVVIDCQRQAVTVGRLERLVVSGVIDARCRLGFARAIRNGRQEMRELALFHQAFGCFVWSR